MKSAAHNTASTPDLKTDSDRIQLPFEDSLVTWMVKSSTTEFGFYIAFLDELKPQDLPLVDAMRKRLSHFNYCYYDQKTTTLCALAHSEKLNSLLAHLVLLNLCNKLMKSVDNSSTTIDDAIKKLLLDSTTTDMEINRILAIVEESKNKNPNDYKKVMDVFTAEKAAEAISLFIEQAELLDLKVQLPESDMELTIITSYSAHQITLNRSKNSAGIRQAAVTCALDQSASDTFIQCTLNHLSRLNRLVYLCPSDPHTFFIRSPAAVAPVDPIKKLLSLNSDAKEYVNVMNDAINSFVAKVLTPANADARYTALINLTDNKVHIINLMEKTLEKLAQKVQPTLSKLDLNFFLNPNNKNVAIARLLELAKRFKQENNLVLQTHLEEGIKTLKK